MNRPGVPAPNFVKRIGVVVERRPGVDFQELHSRSLMNRLSLPSMPFGWTVNPFRGCEFGCRYCYARPTHEYLGHGEPEEFEERIYVKRGEDQQLLADLRRARDSGQEIALGAATDPYQPAEGRFEVTRQVLQAMARVQGLRVGITTKSALVTRDLDLLGTIAAASELWVNFSVISLDAALLRLLEPRAPRPDLRLRAMRTLSAAGIRTRVFIMPVLPLITDGAAGLGELLRAARASGAREAIAQPLFLEFLEREFPWAVPRYRELYPEPGNAPRAYREGMERLVARLAREAGFSARSRDERVRDEASARPRQLSLVW
jgi:DNA repair photolyase